MIQITDKTKKPNELLNDFESDSSFTKSERMKHHQLPFVRMVINSTLFYFSAPLFTFLKMSSTVIHRFNESCAKSPNANALYCENKF